MLGIAQGDPAGQQVGELLAILVALRWWRDHWHGRMVQLVVKADKVTALAAALWLAAHSSVSAPAPPGAGATQPPPPAKPGGAAGPAPEGGGSVRGRAAAGPWTVRGTSADGQTIRGRSAELDDSGTRGYPEPWLSSTR